MTTDVLPRSSRRAEPLTGGRRAAGGAAVAVAGIGSVQLGAAQATALFPVVGPGGMVLLRLVIAAFILLVVVRPRLRGRTDWPVVIAFGLVLAAMNASLYQGIARLPLGMAIAIELTGPLVVAAWGARRAGGLRWAVLAALGVVGLVVGEVALDVLGLLFVLAAAAGWAGYILLSRESGRRSAGADGLALSMVVAAFAVAPLGVASGGAALLRPEVLAVGAVVAVLSSAIPYSCDLLALRRLAAHTFGVLMALNPVVAALAGWALLGQVLAPLQVLAIGLVVVAAAGAVLASTRPTPRLRDRRAPATPVRRPR